jgi:ZIP family zinc transporter
MRLLDFVTLHPIQSALIATLFTWLVTALGAACIFFFKNAGKKTMNVMLGLAAGIMLAASYWSLLAPAIEMAEEMGMIKWLPALAGFLAGGLFLYVLDKIIPHLHLGLPKTAAEGPKTNWKRSILLVLAITIHNIPEGLAVGVAFGAAASGLPSASLGAAIALALGIGLQNFPEGFAVAAPLRQSGLSPFKSFWYGQLSGIVEPLAGVAGAALVLIARPVLPYMLSFAAGAMIFVVIEELIPEAQEGSNGDLATLGALAGFAIMMFLDVALG